MLIGFVTSGLPCSGNSLEKGALGGSETALICMAREMAKRGHEVRVYCECTETGTFDGVSYLDRKYFPAQAAVLPFDVLIASRWGSFLTLPSYAGLRVLWAHDVLADTGSFMSALWQTDLVMLLSDFHIDNYCKEVPELRSLIWKTKNGIDPELIRKNIRPKVPNKVIYTSRPERGLLTLLTDVFPRLLKEIPDLRLHYSTYDMMGLELPEPVQRVHDECKKAAKALAGHVLDMGCLTKEQLYQQISSSQLMLYPTNFPEISCLSMQESQYCGTPVVTTKDFALVETVGDGIGGVLIDGHPNDPVYIDQFVDTTLRLLRNKDEYQKLSQGGPKYVEEQGYTWEKIAATWERRFQDMLDTRFRENKQKVLTQLVRNNDLVPAKLIANKEGLKEEAEKIEAQIKTVLETPAETQPEVIRRRFESGVHLYRKVLELVSFSHVEPKKVLDYLCDDMAFGMVCKRSLPNTEVTLLARDADVAKRLDGYCRQASLEVEIVTELAKDRKFDTVFIGDQVDMVQNPQEYVQKIAADYLTSDGVMVLTTRFGTDRPTAKGTPTRLWNFDFADLKAMFGGQADFQTTLHDEELSQTREMIGHWCTIFRNPSNIGKIDIAGKIRRTRPYQSLTACMIAYNEDSWIRGCIKEFKDIVDKVVVAVDAKSTDKTLDIVRELGCEARLVPFEDFGQLRNSSLKDVDTDWILVVDPDEKVIGADKVRGYLNTSFYEGYGIKQCHLMLDLHGTFDIPVRLFKNRPHYKYVGCIHEHAEDTSKGYDSPIAPTLTIDDVVLAHYGYLNEKVRRTKCSRRNIELLQKDILENGNKGRMLTRVLQIRDYLNIVKWSAEKTRGYVEKDSREHVLLNAAVSDYLFYFGDRKHRYHEIVYPMYQEALMVLGANGLCYEGRNHPPFQVAFCLAGAIGELENAKKLSPDTMWFLDDEEATAFIRQRAAHLVTRLGVASEEKYADQLAHRVPPTPSQLPDPIELLSWGLNVI